MRVWARGICGMAKKSRFPSHSRAGGFFFGVFALIRRKKYDFWISRARKKRQGEMKAVLRAFKGDEDYFAIRSID